MKYNFVTLLALLLFSSMAEAGLHAFSLAGEKHVIYDDKTRLAWFADMSDTSRFHGKDYADQVNTVSQLNKLGNEFYGLKGWHIATETELDSLVSNNELYDIAKKFKLFNFENTNVAVGRYENSINPPKNGHHHVFNITYLECCESKYGDIEYPYEQLIEKPGPNNDFFLYAHPRPIDGNISNGQLPDINVSGLGTWVATGNAMLVGDKLVSRDSVEIRKPLWMEPTVYGFSALALFLITAWWLIFKKKKDE